MAGEFRSQNGLGLRWEVERTLRPLKALVDRLYLRCHTNDILFAGSVKRNADSASFV